MGQRLLRTMAILIGLLNVTLTAATAVLVLLARERLGLGSVGYGLLFTCMAAGGILGSVIGDRLIGWVTATWTIRIGLLIEAGCISPWPPRVTRISSASRCSPLACTARCGPSRGVAAAAADTA